MNVVSNSYLEYLLKGKLFYSKDNCLGNISEVFVACQSYYTTAYKNNRRSIRKNAQSD